MVDEMRRGKVYEFYVRCQSALDWKELEGIVGGWDSKTPLGKFISCFNPLKDSYASAEAARDLMIYRENPNGEAADRVKKIMKGTCYFRKC